MSENHASKLQEGIDLLQQSRFAKAAEIFRSIIASDQDDGIAHANLGLALKGLGRMQDAIEPMKRAAELRPEDSSVWYNLARVLGSIGRNREAGEASLRAVELAPDFGPALLTLGRLQLTEGRLNEAAVTLRRAVGRLPRLGPARTALARALLRTGESEAARTESRRATELSPSDPEAHALLARAALMGQDPAEAESSARGALALDSDHVDALNARGIALQMLARDTEALQCLEHAAKLAPDQAETLSNFGALLNKLSRGAEAKSVLERAVALAPTMALAHANLAYAFNQLSDLSSAAECARRSLELDPCEKQAHMQLAYARHYQGDLRGALEAYDKILRLDSRDEAAASNSLYLLTYDSETPPLEIAERHRAWGRTFEARTPEVATGFPKRKAGRKLKIGYVSPDFRSHSVALFLEPIIERHDRSAFEVYCYSNVTNPDEVTRRFERLSNFWRPIAGLGDDEAARRITRDEIDILIDLAGHTSGNRLGVFARRPAPVQLSYLGYPNTTGLSRIDHYLTDRWCDPPDERDDLFSEKLWRLEGCKLCYRPRTDLPEPGPLPADENGFVSFGSFNNLVKYSPAVIQLWSRVLKRVPESILVLKARWFEDIEARENFRRRFERHGIERDRLRLVDYDHNMGDIDIALDPFPFNGATTTCHALFMGLPIVALQGNCHAARVSHSLLSALGLEELSTANEEDYVETAARLAQDPNRLRALRGSLRTRLLESPICDERSFVLGLEAAYRDMWKAWIGNSGEDPAEAHSKAI